MSEMKKVVFVDDGINKTARGHVEFVNGFVKVTDRRGHSILINEAPAQQAAGYPNSLKVQ